MFEKNSQPTGMKAIKLLHAVEILSVKSVTDPKSHLLFTIIVHLAFKVSISYFIIKLLNTNLAGFFFNNHLHWSVYFHYIIYWCSFFVHWLKLHCHWRILTYWLSLQQRLTSLGLICHTSHISITTLHDSLWSRKDPPGSLTNEKKEKSFWRPALKHLFRFGLLLGSASPATIQQMLADATSLCLGSRQLIWCIRWHLYFVKLAWQVY